MSKKMQRVGRRQDFKVKKDVERRLEAAENEMLPENAADKLEGEKANVDSLEHTA